MVAKIKVLVVDDSALMRKMISDMLMADNRIELVGTARDGLDGIEKIQSLRPDVVTMDVEMPRMDGLTALDRIMRESPLPVIMVSSLTHEGAETTLKALVLGCFDFVGKPVGSPLQIKEIEKDLIAKVIAASTGHVRVPSVKTRPQPPKTVPSFAPIQRPTAPVPTPAPSIGPSSPIRSSSRRREIVAIASSTGGPMALNDLISKLPRNLPVPVVITQHMPKDFTASFAKRLDAVSELHVVEGYNGLELKPGLVVIAPGGSHLEFVRKNGAVVCQLSDAPPVLSVKPAANIMFLSVADEFAGNVVCVILTGMGRDGTDGAVYLHQQGAYVIAESQKTCVVYGMPKAAVEAGIVDEILPLNDIPDAIVRLLQ